MLGHNDLMYQGTGTLCKDVVHVLRHPFSKFISKIVNQGSEISSELVPNVLILQIANWSKTKVKSPSLRNNPKGNLTSTTKNPQALNLE